MNDILPFLKELLNAPGISGYENPAASIIETRWKPLTQEISRNALGSLQALSRGTAKPPRPAMLIAAHMDAIGLMVTGIQDGFLRFTQVGGVDARILPGTGVTIFASGASQPNPIPAVVAQPPDRLLPGDIGSNPVPMEYLFLDTGLLGGEVSRLIRVGDVVAYSQPPVELSGGTLSGHSLDNRASVAALTLCLEELQSRPHAWDVWAVASSLEERGYLGAITSAFKLRPAIAIALDVTFAKSPGSEGWQTSTLGRGPTLCVGPNTHPALYKALKALAEKQEIPIHPEYAPRHTGTDAFGMQVVAEGIPSLVVGIPLRYMHTPTEVVAVRDIQRAGRLLAEFAASLEVDFIEKITWDD